MFVVYNLVYETNNTHCFYHYQYLNFIIINLVLFILNTYYFYVNLNIKS